ncbi:MAG: FAD-dependent oxidoreductase [Candidatus Rokubacteria bacterium]|nr:FAD-dependent oxidoreductase [Candidatus Rokubacteria bacterium]
MVEAMVRPRLFSSGKMGPMQLRNRVVMAPMVVQLASESGAVTQRTIDYYVRRAAGGAGLVIVEASYIAPEAKAFACQLGIDRDGLVPGHFELVEAIHRHGAKVALQIHHGGGRADPALTGGVLVTPSPVAQDAHAVVPREATPQEIETWAESYARAAGRAQRAGYDAVEIHGAHGYLIHEFLSPASNRRSDAYGGSPENRRRFAGLVIRQVREAVGARFPILFRMSAEGGYGIEEAVEIAQALEAWGVDAIHVSVGGTAPITLVPPDTSPMARPEGWLTGHAATIKKRVSVPIIVVGEIRHPVFAEEVLAQGKADFIALGRQLLADPDWPAKAEAGRDDEIRLCISCDHCRLALLLTRPIRCLVNPEVGREREFSAFGPAAAPKRVIVVGGGPAGLEAARAAAARGHHVTLSERSAELGGQLHLAALPPHKEKIEWLRRCLVTQARKAGVELSPSTIFRPEGLAEGEADAVVVATGARPVEEQVRGARAGQVFSAWEVLEGRPPATDLAVVVLGGRQMGCETAEFLAERGNRVTLVSRSRTEELAGDVVASYRGPLLARLRRLGVALRTRCDVREVRDGQAIVVEAGGREEAVDADLVILARGSMPEPTWLELLRTKVPEVYVVGDCVEPRMIADALYEGAWAGSQI